MKKLLFIKMFMILSLYAGRKEEGFTGFYCGFFSVVLYKEGKKDGEKIPSYVSETLFPQYSGPVSQPKVTFSEALHRLIKQSDDGWRDGCSDTVKWLCEKSEGRVLQQKIGPGTLPELPLIYAIERGNVAAVETLLQVGASREVEDTVGCSPLCIAESLQEQTKGENQKRYMAIVSMLKR